MSGLVPAWVGVDPGGRETGVVVRHGEWPRSAVIVRRGGEDDVDGSWHRYLAEVKDAVMDAWLLAEQLDDHVGTVVSVEWVSAPTGFKHGQRQPINLDGVIGTALVLGMLMEVWPDAVIVAPAGHGSAPLATYPDALVAPGEVKGTGRFRHCRSAWDIALAGARQAAVAERAIAR